MMTDTWGASLVIATVLYLLWCLSALMLGGLVASFAQSWIGVPFVPFLDTFVTGAAFLGAPLCLFTAHHLNR